MKAIFKPTYIYIFAFLLAFGLAIAPALADHGDGEVEESNSETAEHSDHSDHSDHDHGGSDADDKNADLKKQIDAIRAALAEIAALAGKKSMGHMSHDKKDDHAHDHGSHDHGELYEVDAEGAPTIEVTVHKDPGSGWNVEIETTNYTITPENASTDHVDNEGHAHVYVDGKKINRMYGNWYHLSSLGGAGDHTVRVELSTNDHKTYAIDGVEIDDSVVVTVE